MIFSITQKQHRLLYTRKLRAVSTALLVASYTGSILCGNKIMLLVCLIVPELLILK